MNKFLLLFFSFILVSCVGTKTIEPQRDFDYSQEDIRQNSLKEIDKTLDKIEESLLKVYLLKEAVTKDDSDYDTILSKYEEIVTTVNKRIDESLENKDYLAVLRLCTSLKSLNIPLSNEEGYNLAIEKFNLVQDINSIIENQKLSSFINGTVTIWIDKGYKIEGGLGYADGVIGSGFFIDPKGYIITNYHVIESEVNPAYEGFSKLYIKLASDSETKIPAKVIGYDKELDLALIKVEINAPYVFSLGTSIDLDIGDKIFAIGSPVGLERTITSGIISADKRQVFSVGTVLQLDAAVNGGNSGGPIINDKGIVQGIVFAGIQSYQGLNFAIPVEYLKTILSRLYNGGEVKHVWTGFYGKTYKEYPSDEKGIGVEVLYVMSGSNANISGLQEHDIVTSVNNIQVSSIEELQNAYLTLFDTTVYRVKILRGNEEKELPILFDSRPEYPGKLMYERELFGTACLPLFGMRLVNSSTYDKRKYYVDNVIKGSIADENGFSQYDAITIVRTYLDEKKGVFYSEVHTKKSKKGYLDINLVLGTSLDSPYFF